MNAAERSVRRLLAAVAIGVVLAAAAWLCAEGQDPRQVSPEARQHVEAGMEAKKAKRLDEAICEFLQAIEHCPHCVDAHWGLAWCCAESDRKDQAVDAFRQVIGHDVIGDKAKAALAALGRLEGDLPKRTYVLSLDGASCRCLGLPVVPVESPEGGRLLFAWKYEHQALPDIYVANAEGEVVENLTKSPGVWERSPAWSPDGSKIAFGWQKSATSVGLSVLDVASGRPEALVKDIPCDEPAWAPDGSKIAFQGAGQLWVIPAEGGDRTPLTERGARARAPAWLPDGTRIAYQAWSDGQWDLFVVSADGGESQRLTDDPAHDFAPLWFPDGQRILFASTRDSHGERTTSDLYVLDVATGEVTRLTSTPESEGRASWAAGGRGVYVQAGVAAP
jgi:Tol biopolymer transport system component